MPFRRINYFWVLAAPLAFLWALLSRIRRSFYPKLLRYKSTGKVICIGNIHSGGSGKTPLVFELLKRYESRNPVVLSRGYKARLSKLGARVDIRDLEGAVNFGDEPWMLAQRISSPIYISKRRVNGIKLIESDFPNALSLLDDGFQHLALERDLDIICINTDKELTENFCIPLGDLREPLSALNHAGVLILIPGTNQESHTRWREFLNSHFNSIPQFQAIRKSAGIWKGEARASLESGSWCGFCGIAEPQRFIHDFSEIEGVNSFLNAYPDHHEYSKSDVDWLCSQRKEKGASGFVTTDKDWYKLKDRFELMGEKLLSLRIYYELPEAFWALVDACVGGA